MNMGRNFAASIVEPFEPDYRFSRKFIEIINCITDIFYVLDQQFCFKYVNDKCARYFNKTKQELIGKNIWKLYPLIIDTPYYPFFSKAMTEKATLHFEHQAIYSDLWFDIYVYSLKEGIAVFARDTTKRKLTEIELQKSSQRTLDVLESIGDGFTSLDRHLHYTYANHAAEEMLGYTRGDLIGKSLIELFPEANQTTIELSRKAIREGTKQHAEFYSMILKKWLEFNVYPYKGGVCIYFRDITERKKTAERLRLTNELFYKTVNANPLPMAILTAKEERDLDVNDSFLNINGYTREEVIGSTRKDIEYLWVDLKQRSKFFDLLMKNGFVDNLEVNFRNRSGEISVSSLSAVLVDWKGENCILAIDNNITELRRYQDELSRLDRMHLVGEMAAGLGHELRNPMTTVRGFLQHYSLKEAFLPYKESFNMMINELDRANFIITEFLKLAKDKTSNQKTQQLNKIIQTIHPSIQIDALKSNKNIYLDLSPLPELKLDEKEIRQLLHNLVRNGLEAIKPGGAVTIKTFIEGEEVILAIHNNGPVIQPEVLDKIGTPFFTTKDYGTGLGLAICYSIASRHNAKIDIETSPTGTTFSVRFKQANLTQ